MPLAAARGAVRTVVRAPAVFGVTTVLVAVGLGFALALWSLVDALYLRPLPFPAGERIVAIYEVHPERGRMAVVPANFLDWSPTVSAFSHVSGSQWIEANLETPDGPQRRTGARVLPGYFDVWGVRPLLGRTPSESDHDTATPVAVISERVWRITFGADPNALGSSIRIDGIAHTVIGVMPAASSVVGHVDVWVLWRMTALERTERRYHMMETVGRLRDQRTADEATGELQAAYVRLADTHPDAARDWRARAVPLRDHLMDVPGGALWLMAGVVAITFAVACLNTAALLAGWWAGRSQELRTRTALGATRLRLVRDLVAESIVMATTGVIGAVLLAQACLGLFTALAAPTAGAYDFAPQFDARVAFAGAAMFGMFIVTTAVWPACRATSGATALVASPRVTDGVGSHLSAALQLGAAFVAGAIALALVANVRQLTTLARDQARPVQAVEVVLPDVSYRDDASNREFFTRLLSALAPRPEIAGLGASSYVPPSQALGNLRFEIEGRSTSSDAQSASPAAVEPPAFRQMGVGLVRGRLFDERDGPGAPDVCIVSDALARRYWGTTDPIGQRLTVVGLERPVTIIGVVSDLRQPLSKDPRAEAVLYLPFRQVPWPFMTLLIEPAGDEAAALRAVAAEVSRIDATIALGAPRPLAAIQREWLQAPRRHAAAISLFATATVLVTLAGVYAVTQHRVTRRRREWAVRQALGATPGRLHRLVLRDVATTSVAGLAIGFAALPPVSWMASGVVYGATLMSWPIDVLLAISLCAAALAAALEPVGRLIRHDLSQLLREG